MIDKDFIFCAKTDVISFLSSIEHIFGDSNAAAGAAEVGGPHHALTPGPYHPPWVADVAPPALRMNVYTNFTAKPATGILGRVHLLGVASQ
jgi:hypothetical protein